MGRKVSILRGSKPGPRRRFQSKYRFKAFEFEMPPERARQISYEFVGKNKENTQWVYKKNNKTYTIIVEGRHEQFAAGDWRKGNAVQMK